MLSIFLIKIIFIFIFFFKKKYLFSLSTYYLFISSSYLHNQLFFSQKFKLKKKLYFHKISNNFMII